MTEQGDGSAILIASVTVIFRGSGAAPAAPTAVAEELMETEDVATVRIGEHGRVSVFRVDSRAASPQLAAAEAEGLASRIALRHGLEADVIGVVLTTDDERHEVLRIGTPDDGQT